MLINFNDWEGCNSSRVREMEESGGEAGNSIDSIVQSFSKLLKQLDSDNDREKEKVLETCLEQGGSEKLRKLHEDIVEIQGSIEKYQLFKEGQDLYSKWLLLVEQQSDSWKDDCDSSSDLKTTDLKDRQLGDLVALSYNNRGYLKYLQVDFKGALEDYTLALKHDSTLACAYYNRGLVTYRLAFFEQAVQDMTTAVNLDPNREEFHEGLRKVSEMIGSPIEHKFRLPFGDCGQGPENS